MKKRLIIAGLAFCCAIVVHAQEAVAPAVQTTDTDWCTIEVPATAKIGETVAVKFTLKNIDPGLKLFADLHGRNTSGKGIGMVKWGGKPKDAASGQVVVFNILVAPKPDLASVRVQSYLSTEEGAFKGRVKEAAGANIKIIE